MKGRLIKAYNAFLMLLPPLMTYLYLFTITNFVSAVLVGIGVLYLQVLTVERALRYVALSRYMTVKENRGLLLVQNKERK